MNYEAHIISTQLNLMPFPYKILVQEISYLHANSVVNNIHLVTSLLTKYNSPILATHFLSLSIVSYETRVTVVASLNLMLFPCKILVQEMKYLHANSVVKNTTYWLILIIPDNAYVHI